jgi:hypothetical protein
MNQLNVPWDKIKESVEAGMPMRKVASLFDIKLATIKARSLRGKWDTPKRRSDALKQAIEEQGNRVTESQGRMAAVNKSLTEQIMAADAAQKPTSAASVVDIDQATKDYRNKGIQKMAMLLDQSIVAPPRNWKDMDIADKMMRRLLGIDDNEGKVNTIVSLQLVNERLMAQGQDVVIEGEFIAESVLEVSDPEPSQSNLTGLGSVTEEN